MHYCEGVEIQRHRDTMIYSREDARYFDICRVADRMDVSNDDSLTTVENDSLILRKQNFTPITHQQTNYPNDEIKITHCVGCSVKLPNRLLLPIVYSSE